MPLTYDQVTKYRNDATWNNNWRYESAIDLDYYDGNQFNAELAQKMRDKTLPLITVNVIRSVIETALGLQERALTDWIVRPEDDDQAPVADVLTYRMKQAERESLADRVCLDAFANMCKGGIDWVEVSRNSDPFGYPYRVTRVPYTEMWTDPRSIRADYKDAQYIRRVRFIEREQLKERFPDKVWAVESAGRGDYTTGWYEPEMFQRSEHYARDMTNVSTELWGGGRDLVAVEEIQHKEIENSYVVKLKSGRTIAFDEQNPLHMLAYNQGLIDVNVAPVQVIWQSMWCRETKLLERRSPGGSEFTYVPFVVEREARTGAPYGLIRSIRSLQDEINTRWAKSAWAMISTRVIADDDAVDDHDVAREEIGKRNSYIRLSKMRGPNSQFKVEDGLAISDKQLEKASLTMSLIPQISGVPLSLQGIRDGQAVAGVAITQLVDQGINSLARTNAHYREARRRVGYLLLNLIIEDIGCETQVLCGKDRKGGSIKVPVNVPTFDPQAQASYIQNDLTAMRLNVVLDDIQHSATHRSEQFQALMQAVSAMPPEVQQVALPYMVQLMDAPPEIKKELSDLLKQRLGLAVAPSTPEEAQQQQEQAAAEQEQKQRAMQLQEAELMGKIKGLDAKAAVAQAQAQKTAAETAVIVHDAAQPAQVKVVV